MIAQTASLASSREAGEFVQRTSPSPIETQFVELSREFFIRGICISIMGEGGYWGAHVVLKGLSRGGRIRQ